MQNLIVRLIPWLSNLTPPIRPLNLRQQPRAERAILVHLWVLIPWVNLRPEIRGKVAGRIRKETGANVMEYPQDACEKEVIVLSPQDGESRDNFFQCIRMKELGHPIWHARYITVYAFGFNTF